MKAQRLTMAQALIAFPDFCQDVEPEAWGYLAELFEKRVCQVPRRHPGGPRGGLEEARGVPGYESWRDVAVAEVPEMESVQRARAQYERAREQERDFHGIQG